MKAKRKLPDVVKNNTSKQSVTKKVSENSSSNQIDYYINKYGLVIALFIVFIISLIVFKDFLFLKKVFFFKDIGSDTINVDYPSLKLWEIIHQDHFFVPWCFNIGMGAPISFEIPNPFNPLVYSSLVVKPLVDFLFTSDIGLNRFGIIYMNMMISNILFYLYSRTLGLTKYVSIIGTILFSFLGFTVMGSTWGHTFDIFIGVSLLFAFEQLFKKKRWYFFPIAIMLFGGHLYYIYLYGVFLFIYFLFRYLDEKEWNTKEFTFLLLQMTGLGLLGLAMNLVNSLPGFLMMLDSPRVAGNSTYYNLLISNQSVGVSHYLEHVTTLLRLFSTDILGNGNNFKGWSNYYEAAAFYCGLSTLLLFPQIFSHINLKRKILYGGMLILWGLISFVPALRYAFLLYAGDYFRRGIDFFVPITLLFVSLQSLQKLQSSFKINKIVLAATFIILLTALLFPYFPNNQFVIDNKIRNNVIIFLVLYSGLIFMFSIKSLRQLSMILFLLLITVEAGYFSSVTMHRRLAYSKKEFLNQAGGFNDNSVAAINYTKSNDKNFYRTEKDYSSGSGMHGSLNDAQVQNYFGTTNYSSFNQGYYIHFLEETDVIQKGVETQTRWAPGLRSRPLLQSIASVKYNLSKSEKPFMLNAGYSVIKKFDDVWLLNNNYFIPFGFTYNQYMLMTDFKKLSNGLQKDLALLRSFIIDDSLAFDYKSRLSQIQNKDTIQNFDFTLYKQFVDKLKKDTLQITEFKHNKIKGQISLDSSKMMFLSIPYDKGWTAKVDGIAEKLQIVNIGFMGLMLDKGKHNIELSYLPPYFTETLIISIISTLIFLVLFIFYSGIRKKYLLWGLTIIILYPLYLMMI